MGLDLSKEKVGFIVTEKYILTKAIRCNQMISYSPSHACGMEIRLQNAK